MTGPRTPLPDHGDRARYQRGCRCSPCKRANTIYQRSYRAQWETIKLGDGSRIVYRQPSLPLVTR